MQVWNIEWMHIVFNAWTNKNLSKKRKKQIRSFISDYYTPFAIELLLVITRRMFGHVAHCSADGIG